MPHWEKSALKMLQMYHIVTVGQKGKIVTANTLILVRVCC